MDLRKNLLKRRQQCSIKMISRKMKAKRRAPKKAAASNNCAESARSGGLAHTQIPERIIGATKFNEKMFFLFKWVDDDLCVLIAAKEANIKYPQTVIEFYEKHLTWD